MFDTSHPWFRPLWRRVSVCVVTGGWGLFEFSTGSIGWAMIFLALAGWCVWSLLVTYSPDSTKSDDGKH